jgi:predicted dehydrogenase
MNKGIGFGTVGFGMIGRTHLTAMMANLALHGGAVNGIPRALCTRRPDENAGLPYEKIYASPDQLIKDDQVRVVDICTPNNLHGAVAREALKAGKCVYVEKPLSGKLDEAGGLYRLARETGLPNQCALVMRFRPLINRMKDMLEAGAIGDVIHFRSCYFHGSYLDPERPTSWRQQLDMSGGGSVMDLGIHVLDLVRYLMGDVLRLQAVSRIVHKIRYPDGGRTAPVPNETDEYLRASLEMENGAAGIMESSRVSTSTICNEGMEIFGTKGSLMLNFEGAGSLALAEAGGRGPLLVTGGAGGKYEEALRPLLPGSRQSLGAFVDAHAAAIKNMANWSAGLPPFPGTPTFAEAVKAQALVHACLRSARADGRWESPEALP